MSNRSAFTGSLVVEGVELDPQSRLIQVCTPMRGNTQACKMIQRAAAPTGIKSCRSSMMTLLQFLATMLIVRRIPI